MRLFSPEPVWDNRHDRLLHHIQVSAALSQFRVQSGLSVAEAANRAGIAEPRLSKLEAGSEHYLASEEEIAELARIYHMSSKDRMRFDNSIRYLRYGHGSTDLAVGALMFVGCIFSLASAASLVATNSSWGRFIHFSACASVFLVLAFVEAPTTKPRVWLYRARLLAPSSSLSSAPSGKTDLSLDESPAIADFDDLAVAFNGIRQELRQADSRALRRDVVMLMIGTVSGFLVNVVTGPLVKFFFEP